MPDPKPKLPPGAELVEDQPQGDMKLPAGATIADVAAAPQETQTPGFFKRLAQGVGVPSTAAEAKGMIPSKKEFIESGLSPAGVLAGRMIEGIKTEGKKAFKEEAGSLESIRKGEPVLPNLGNIAATDVEFALKGILGPLGGGSLWAWGEDIGQKNYSGAAGDATAVLVNALLLKGSRKPVEDVRANKLAFAGDLPEKMDAPKQVKAVLPDLDRAAAQHGAPKTVGELLANIKDAKNAMNTESGLAMQKLRGKQFVPTAIADRIKNKITANMDMTPYGRQMKQQLMKAAKDYEKPWSYEALDQERMQARARLRSYYNKSSTGRYAEAKTDASTIIDREVEGGIKDIVYPAMDKAAGTPQGYFGNLKERQSTLIDMEEAVGEQVKGLATRTAKIKGSPRLSTENVSAYGHPAASPGISIHRLQNVVVRPNPLARANRAVARSFSGRPSAQASIWSMPLRQMLLIPTQEPEPPQNRKEALQVLGR